MVSHDIAHMLVTHAGGRTCGLVQAVSCGAAVRCLLRVTAGAAASSFLHSGLPKLNR